MTTLPLKLPQNEVFLCSCFPVEFGTVHALSPRMMHTIIENFESGQLSQCTREEAVELLRALRAGYQILPPLERYLVKSAMLRVAAELSSAKEVEQWAGCEALNV